MNRKYSWGDPISHPSMSMAKAGDPLGERRQKLRAATRARWAELDAEEEQYSSDGMAEAAETLGNHVDTLIERAEGAMIA